MCARKTIVDDWIAELRERHPGEVATARFDDLSVLACRLREAGDDGMNESWVTFHLLPWRCVALDGHTMPRSADFYGRKSHGFDADYDIYTKVMSTIDISMSTHLECRWPRAATRS